MEPRIGKRQLPLFGGPPSRISSTSSALSSVSSMLTAWPQLAQKTLPTSLEAGMRPVAIRETAYIAWHHPGGRSLLTGGTWSLAKQSTIFGNISALCPRCGLAAEDRHHRFWDCEANLCFQGPLFAALRKAGIAQPSSFIADLPVTTRRCGLFVHGFDVSPAAAHAIVEYLCEVNYHADCCAAASKRGAALPDPAPGEAWKRALALHRVR